MSAAIRKDDFRRIRLSLAAAILMIAAGAAAVFGGEQLLQFEKKGNGLAKSQRVEIQGKLARARDEEVEIKKKIARFSELDRRGILGLEQRLEWIEQIRQIKNVRRIPDVQYEIAPQQAVDAAILPGSSANFEFRTSTMQLKMLLLHEEDLINFLADLRDSAKAFLRVRRCEVERLPRGGESRGIPPQLSAACTIDWITIREKRGA